MSKILEKIKKIKSQLLNAALIIVVALTGYGLTIYFDRGTPPANTAPTNIDTAQIADFSFTDINGEAHNVHDFKGKTIIVNFWATWCAPCVSEFPLLLKIAAKNHKDTVLIAMSSDISEDDIKTFLKKQTLPGRNVYIALDKEDVTLKTFGIRRLPETIIAAPDLTQRKKLIGAEWSEKQMQQIIDSLAQ